MTKFIIGLLAGLSAGCLATFLIIKKATAKKIGDFIDGLSSSKETIRQFLKRYLSEEELSGYINGLKKKLSEQIYARASEQSVSDNISQLAVNRLADKLTTHNEEGESSKRGFFGNAVDVVKGALKSRVETAVTNNQETIEQTLSEKINEVVKNNSKEIISQIIDTEIDKILSQPISTLFEGREDMIASLKQRIMR